MEKYEVIDNAIKNELFYTLDRTRNNIPYSLRNMLSEKRQTLYSHSEFLFFKYYPMFLFTYLLTIIIICFLYKKQISVYLSFSIFYFLHLYCCYLHFSSFQKNTRYEIEEDIHNKIIEIPVITCVKISGNRIYAKNVKYKTFQTELEYYNINWNKSAIVYIYTIYSTNEENIKKQIKDFDESFVKNSLSIFIYHPNDYKQNIFLIVLFSIFLLSPLYDLYVYENYKKVNIQILKKLH